MEPDRPPEIRLAGEVEAAPTGETRLPYEGKDDHGIAGAEAEIALDVAKVDRRYGLAVPPAPRPRARRRPADAADRRQPAR